jgi:hypothetical protein
VKNPTEWLLAQWLKLRGIDGYYSLTAEEKRTYAELEATLAGRKLTDEDVAKFWDKTFDDIAEALSAPGLADRERDFLIVELRFARKVRAFLATPEREAAIARFGLEQQLAQS